MKEFAKSFYKSKAWQDCRNNYFDSVCGLCEECLAKGIITSGEIVHHIEPITPDNIDNPMVTLSFSNLKLLCRKHHSAMHPKSHRRYKIDEEGNVILIPDR